MAGHHLPQRLTLPISITATYSVLNLTFYFPLLDKPWSQVSPPSPYAYPPVRVFLFHRSEGSVVPPHARRFFP